VDKDGQLVASCGDEEGIDSTSLASLTAGNIAATGGLAKLLGQKEFSILFHQGEKENIHISLIGGRMILVVIFDTQSTLGLVRLRAKKAGEELNEIFQRLINKAKDSAVSSDALLSDITDEDIERLFS
jgi:predicted regulator of Ras-like GTPase activity (Roadblock/LC7/MglB family)